MSGASRSFPQSAQSGSGAILAWATGTVYAQGQTVTNSGHTYTANDAHTAGATFAGDLASHWTLLPLTAADVGAQPVDSDLTAIAALTTTSYGRAFLALADAAAGRTALGLGTAATQATGAFDASGAAAAAQAASQPLDSDLTAIAALSTTSYGRALLALADASAGRTALGLDPASPTAIHFFGHSFSTATGAPADSAVPVAGNTPSSPFGYTQRVCRALRAQEFNKGTGGCKVQTTNTGGWHEVVKALQPYAREIGTNLSAVAQIVSLDWGINENSGPDQPGFMHGLRTAILVARMSTFLQADDASVAGSGGFGSSQTNAIYNPSKTRGTGGNGDAITLTAPAWFPANCKVAPVFIGTDTKGGILTFSGTSGVSGTLDARTPTNVVSGFCGCAKELTGIDPGETVIATVSSASGGGGPYFLGWGPIAATPPLVLVQDVTPTGSDGSPNDQTTSNASVATVVAEFSSSEVVRVARAAAFLADFDHMLADGTHPNYFGHGVIAKLFLDVVAAKTFPVASVHATA